MNCQACSIECKKFGKHRNGNPPFHAFNERFQQEAGQPQSRLRFALRVLQFLPDTQIASRDTSNGKWHHRSRLEYSRITFVTKRTVHTLRSIIVGIAALVLSGSLLRLGAELCAILIRRRWPEAWFSGLIMWYADFLALALALAIATTAGWQTFKKQSTHL